MTTYLMGADISSHQGPDWEPAADEFYVFVKATEGRSYTNPDHDDQVATIRARGLVVGHYHWLVKGDTDAQVDYFLAQADIQPGDLIALDWEDPTNPPTSEKDDWIRQVLDVTEGANRVGLYCNRDWWLNHDTSSYFGDFLWIANYTSAETPGIQAEWAFWQFTASPYDRNRGRFSDLAELQAWAGSGDGGDPGPPQPTGGAWYSTDYLDLADAPPPAEPGWKTPPTVILDDPTPDSGRNVSYAQAVVRVAPVTSEDGSWAECYVLAQDYENQGDIRFYTAYADGTYSGNWMQVNDAGHGQTFHAYRSAAGNLYVWCGEDPAYRYRWQSGKKVSKTSGDKMDYKGCRPVGSHEPWVGFRDATDTNETFYLFDRTDFTDGTNRTKPAKSVTVAKRQDITQQSWAVTEDRIYRVMGSTNDNPPHGTRLHILDVFDWSGKLLLDRLDITAMAISTTSDEPEGITFTGAPGDVLVGKREGSSDPAKRSYPLWTMVGLP